MVNRAKQKGTAFETEVLKHLKTKGFRRARRQALTGSIDVGDLRGIALETVAWTSELVIQCKNHKKFDLSGWLNAAKSQAAAAENTTESVYGMPIVVAKRPGVGPANTGKHYVIMELDDAISLLKHAGYE